MGYTKSGRAIARVAGFLEQLERIAGEDGGRIEFESKDSVKLAYLLREGLTAAEHLDHPRWGKLKSSLTIRTRPGIVVVEKKEIENVLVVEASFYAPANKSKVEIPTSITSGEVVSTSPPEETHTEKKSYLTFNDRTSIHQIIDAVVNNKGKNFIFEIPEGVSDRLLSLTAKLCVANNLLLEHNSTTLKLTQQ